MDFESLLSALEQADPPPPDDESIDYQHVAAGVIFQSWTDSGSYRPVLERAALEFALSRDFDLWCELAEISDQNRERIRLSIELRVDHGRERRKVYRARRAVRRAESRA